MNLLKGLERMERILPAQVLWQQPVIFLDATNRLMPLHLECINSLEIFLAVLQVKFQGLGEEKIRRREFYLQDSTTKDPIDIGRRPWNRCFYPGQAVEMSMTFEHASSTDSMICAACGVEADGMCESGKWYRNPIMRYGILLILVQYALRSRIFSRETDPRRSR
jgi:hypothetical protein